MWTCGSSTAWWVRLEPLTTHEKPWPRPPIATEESWSTWPAQETMDLSTRLVKYPLEKKDLDDASQRQLALRPRRRTTDEIFRIVMQPFLDGEPM